MQNSTLSELQKMIAGTVSAFADVKQRQKALKAVQWRLRGPRGEFVGLKNLRAAYVPENEAFIFDGRDNEETKLRAYQAELLENLTVEIFPQIA